MTLKNEKKWLEIEFWNSITKHGIQQTRKIPAYKGLQAGNSGILFVYFNSILNAAPTDR